MNFSLEIWKRSFQRFGLIDPGKNPAPASKESSSDDEEEEEEEEDEEEEDEEEFEDGADDGKNAFGELKKAGSAMEQLIRVLETRLTYKEAQVLSFEEKLAAAQKKIDEKEKEVAAMSKQRDSRDRLIAELKRESERKMVEWIKKEEAFVAQMQELTSMFEDRSAAWNGCYVEARIDKDRSAALEIALRGKIEELRCAKEARAELETEVQALRKDLDEAGDRLEELGSRAERDKIEKDRRLRDQVAENETLRRQLDEQAAGFEAEAADLRVKASRFEEELREAREGRRRLKSMLAATSLAVNREMVGDEAAERAKELESMLGELINFARDKDERLDASEWAVQQLGLIEVTKVKANLARTERDHLQLKQEFVEIEGKLKIKEKEAAERLNLARVMRRRMKKAEEEAAAMKENLQLAEAKYEGLKAEHEAALSRIAGFEELKSNRVGISRHDDKLREIHLELQKTKTSTKGLMERMLSLQSNLESGGHSNVLCSSSSSPSPGKTTSKPLEIPMLRSCPTSDEQNKKRGIESVRLASPKRQRQFKH